MAKRTRSARNVSVYSNLAHRRRTKKDAHSRKHAEYLASLPKNPVKRILYRLHPKRVVGFWFSRRGAFMALKIAGVAILLIFLLIGALFAYYRKDLDAINPSTLASRVQTTVTRYYDRNGKLLWQDTGSGNYSIVVKSDQINDYMKKATVAIEDKDFYSHGAVSLSGTIRAALTDASGGSTQGGSTLTQQLVKQVFFSGQEQDRGLSGIPRKIKEMILSLEVFRMYSRDQILTLYLNESPYGGPRNGVESAAQTYFGVDAKDLTLPEAALLAAIPNAPGVYNPYNTAGNQALVARQHDVLDKMQQQGYITKQQADDAKSYPILDHIQPAQNQYTGMQAPHFVLMVQQQLQQQLGANVVGQGGLNVTTTLDLDIQNALQNRINQIFDGTMHCNDAITGAGYNCEQFAGFSNGAAAIEDNKTGQLLALVGSRDFNYPGFGQTNAATSFIQPGSSIKPLVYSQLFQDKGNGQMNYGSGSVLSDTKTTFPGGYTPVDDDGKYNGNIPLVDALDWSRNVPAVKAMAISGQQATINTIHAMGDTYYCTQGADAQVGLASAIGGCGTRLIDHVNAMASLARMGSYMPQSTVLKVTNSQGQVLQQYKTSSKQVIDPQAAYVVNQMMGDSKARAGLYKGDYVPILDSEGIHVAAKTGTSNAQIGSQIVPKDVWTVGFTPSLSGAVWLGNNDTTPLKNGNSLIPAKVFDAAMSDAMKIYISQGKAKTSDWFTAPPGIQVINGFYYPSYYNKTQGSSNQTMTFDQISKRVATNCTPPAAQIQLQVTKSTDPYSKQTVITAPDGYDPNDQDNVHQCSDTKPSLGSVTYSGGHINIAAVAGTNPIQSVQIQVNGQTISANQTSGNNYVASYTIPTGTTATITVTVTDQMDYTATQSYTFAG